MSIMLAQFAQLSRRARAVTMHESILPISVRKISSILRTTRSRLNKQSTTSINSIRPFSFTHKFDTIRDELFKNINAVTGVSKLDALKTEVQVIYNELRELRQNLRLKKVSYSKAINDRSVCQSEVNSLLQRKSQWTIDDMTRFTRLCQDEHDFITNERNLKEIVEQCEQENENKSLVYDSILRERYQEEIILGERSKGIANILTWSLLILNTIIFVYSQLVNEPSKRLILERKVEKIIKAIEIPLDRIECEVKDLVIISRNIQSIRHQEIDSVATSDEYDSNETEDKFVAEETKANTVAYDDSSSKSSDDYSVVTGMFCLAAILLISRPK